MPVVQISMERSRNWRRRRRHRQALAGEPACGRAVAPRLDGGLPCGGAAGRAMSRNGGADEVEDSTHRRRAHGFLRRLHVAGESARANATVMRTLSRATSHGIIGMVKNSIHYVVKLYIDFHNMEIIDRARGEMRRKRAEPLHRGHNGPAATKPIIRPDRTGEGEQRWLARLTCAFSQRQ